jgi:hypothetical protein
MAEKDDLIQIIQMKVQDLSSEYIPHIETALKLVWATVASYSDWWFMRSPEPQPISLTAGEDTYVVDNTDIGKMLHIANDANRKLWIYKGRQAFDAYREGTSDSSTGNTQVFTDLGLKRKKRVIQIYQPPSAVSTVYLHYQRKGTIDNLNLMPDEWAFVLVHGVMSLIAPPQEVNQAFWKALCYKESKMFEGWLMEMKRLVEPASDEEEELILDSLTKDRLQEIDDL